MHRTRAKFYVQAVTLFAGSGGGNVVLVPVTRGAANAPWSSATPSGKIEMSITNPAAFEQFRAALGRELYVDFTEADPAMLNPTTHPYVDAGLSSGTYGYACCVECGKPENEHVS